MEDEPDRRDPAFCQTARIEHLKIRKLVRVGVADSGAHQTVPVSIMSEPCPVIERPPPREHGVIARLLSHMLDVEVYDVTR